MDIVSSPLIYERTVNSILKRKIQEGETNIKLKNPRALYRIGILGFERTNKTEFNGRRQCRKFFCIRL